MELEKFREHKSCLLCGNDDYEVLYHWPANHYPHDKFETCSWDGRQSIDLTIVCCNHCSMVYTTPAFKEEYLDLVYPEDIVAPGTGLKPVSLEKNKWKEIIRQMDRFLEHGAVVCDIGTRYGEMVKLLMEKDYTAFGVELNKASVNVARQFGLPVYEGRIETLDQVLTELNYERVNAFVMDDVLEHLVYPKKNLENLSAFQKKGDFLFLRQMDHGSLGRKLFRKNWYYYQPAAHMGFFDEKTLKEMLSDVGYEVMAIKRASLERNLLYFAKYSITWFFDITRMGNWVNRLAGKKIIKSILQVYNGKVNYNSLRPHLEDMFLVIARKS